MRSLALDQKNISLTVDILELVFIFVSDQMEKQLYIVEVPHIYTEPMQRMGRISFRYWGMVE